MRIAAKLPRPSRMGKATLALPLAAALALPLMPAANAQSPAGGLAASSGPGSGTGYLEPHDAPAGKTVRATAPPLAGLPDGGSVAKAEGSTDRGANVYISSAAMRGKPVKLQILLARDWYSKPNQKSPTVWALDGLRAREDESGWTLSTNIANFYADKNVNVVLPVGGESSFYTDWQQPDNGKHYKWESFLVNELPAVLREGRSEEHTSELQS